mmetsp:Transcript_31612/g.48350  ORF Transcript_31612/g.48350 Transcript_31612/m.48350 type:complete len:208 (+) Transcript_31612:879-1502(+)
MSYDVVALRRALQVCLLDAGLVLELVLVFSLTLIKGVSEELHVGASSSDILLDLLPDYVVFEVLVPNAFPLDAQRVVTLEVRVAVLLVLHVGYHNKVILQAFVHFPLVLHNADPLGGLSWQVAHQYLPDDGAQSLDLRRNPSEGEAPQHRDLYLATVQNLEEVDNCLLGLEHLQVVGGEQRRHVDGGDQFLKKSILSLAHRGWLQRF